LVVLPSWLGREKLGKGLPAESIWESFLSKVVQKRDCSRRVPQVAKLALSPLAVAKSDFGAANG
jgi:hypothetical protein